MSKICCFTGHRSLTYAESELAASRLKKLIPRLLEEGYTDFRTGGAVGFDALAALQLLDAREKHPEIKLHLILPCKDQDRGFSDIQRRVYHYTIRRADSVHYLQDSYSSGVMLARNRALVDGSDLCISFMTRLSGGTYSTVSYARKCGIRTVNLYTAKQEWI